MDKKKEDDLDSKIAKLLERQKANQKDSILLSSSNFLSKKYETINVIALKKIKDTEKQQNKKALNDDNEVIKSREVTPQKTHKNGNKNNDLSRITQDDSFYDLANNNVVINVMNSPMRGKIRPKSAPYSTERKVHIDNNTNNTTSSNANIQSPPHTPQNNNMQQLNASNGHVNSSEYVTDSNDLNFYSSLQHNNTNKNCYHFESTPVIRLNKSNSERNNMINYLDPNLWWDEAYIKPERTRTPSHAKISRSKSDSAIKKKDKGNKADSPNSHSNINHSHNDTQAKGKSKKLALSESERNFFYNTTKPSNDNQDNEEDAAQRKNLAKEYLRERKLKEDKAKEDLATKIREEAYNMEARCYSSVDEANSYAAMLGKAVRYAIHTQPRKDALINPTAKKDLRRQDSASVRSGVFSQSYNEKNEALGAGQRLSRMMVQVTNGSTEPARIISLDNFYYEHDKLQSEVRRSRCLMPSDERVRSDKQTRLLEQEKEMQKSTFPSPSDVKSSLKQSGSTEPDNKLKHSVSFLDPSDNAAFDTKGSSRGNFVSHSISATNRSGNIPSRPSSPTKPTSTKLSRKETEEFLNKIIHDTSAATKLLEDQLHEIHMKGWNKVYV